VRSQRLDRVYRLIVSEITKLTHLDPVWDPLLIQHRYFFPMTIERNLEWLVAKQLLYIVYDDALLSTINRLMVTGQLTAILKTMIDLNETTTAVFSYTQNASQIADYMAATLSDRQGYVIPKVNGVPNPTLVQFYKTVASVDGRSLLVAFLEQCLLGEVFTLETLPNQYLRLNTTQYPYIAPEGGYYGINTPIRIFDYTIARSE